MRSPGERAQEPIRPHASIASSRPRPGPRIFAVVRIVSLLPSATDVIAELGLLDSLVGVSEDCNWPPEVASKPLVARTRIDVSGLTGAEIDELLTASHYDRHSLYAVDAARMAGLRPD